MNPPAIFQSPRVMRLSGSHGGTLDDTLCECLMRAVREALAVVTPQAPFWAGVLYLEYSDADRRLFDLWPVRHELKRLLVDYTRRQRAVAGGSREKWGYSMELVRPEGPLLCRRETSLAARSVDLDLHLSAAAPGSLGAGRLAITPRVLPVLPDDELLEVVVQRSDGVVAPHIDLSQRGARGRRQEIYLTRSFPRALLGPSRGCDLLVASAADPQWISDGDCPACAPGAGHTLIERLRAKRTIMDFECRVVGRVLPRRAGDGRFGYGSDWAMGSRTKDRPVDVSMRMDEVGGVALAGATVFAWRQAKDRSDVLTEGYTLRLASGVVFEWRTDPDGHFAGFLDRAGVPSDPVLLPGDRDAGLILGRVKPWDAGESAVAADEQDNLLSSSGNALVHSDGTGGFAVRRMPGSQDRPVLIKCSRGGWENVPAGEGALVSGPFEIIAGTTRFAIAPTRRAFRVVHHPVGGFETLERVVTV